MLELSQLEIRLGAFTLKADFQIEPGSITTILGPSGAGKSTLLSAIAGFLTPENGDVIWQKRSMATLDPGNRAVSILFQDNNLFPHLTVTQNVGLGIKPSLKLTDAEKESVATALAHVGISEHASKQPGSLSGGQQSRAALARVLIQNNPILLLDEPFSALGPALKTEMLELLKNIAHEKGLTVLMVTHDPNDALFLDGQTVFVSDGSANKPMNTKALFDEPTPALARYLS